MTKIEFNKNLLLKVKRYIGEHYLSERLWKYFQNNNISYLLDVVTKTKTSLLKEPNLGRKTLNELEDLLKNFNLTLGMKIPNWSTDDLNELLNNFDNLIENQDYKPKYRQDFFITIDEVEFSVRTQNCLRSLNIRYVGDLIQKSVNNLLREPNFGRKSLNETREFVNKLGLSLNMKIDDWGNTIEEFERSGFIKSEKKIIVRKKTQWGKYEKYVSDPVLLIQKVLGDIKNLSPTNQRSIEVISRRYGLNESRKEETLEEIGNYLGVTRERVRQIEGKAKRKIKFRISSFRERLLKKIVQEIKNLAEKKGSILIHYRTIKEFFKDKSEYFLIVTILVNQKIINTQFKKTSAIRTLINSEFEKFGIYKSIWVTKKIDDELKNNFKILSEQGRDFILPINFFEEKYKIKQADVVEFGPAFNINIYKDYIFKGYITRKNSFIKRIAHLHKVACCLPSPIKINSEIFKLYEQECSEKLYFDDFYRIINGYRNNLFLRISNNTFIALKKPKFENFKTIKMENKNNLHYEIPLKISWETCVNSMFNILKDNPLITGYDLFTKFAELNKNYSRSSGPIYSRIGLQVGKLALGSPGRYATKEYIEEIKDKNKVFPKLFTNGQIRVYARARKSGESINLYPCWNRKQEFEW